MPGGHQEPANNTDARELPVARVWTVRLSPRAGCVQTSLPSILLTEGKGPAQGLKDMLRAQSVPHVT